MIRIKRAYLPASPADGKRILVDRLWPRGVSKDEAKLDGWAKELAPSTELRKWFNHDPEKWTEFQRRYRKELEGREDSLREIAAAAKGGSVTLIYGAKDEVHNEAAVLKQLIENLPGPPQ